MMLAARLLSVAFVVVTLRAAHGQQFQPGTTPPPPAVQRDPYAPQVQQPSYQPPPYQQPADQRYPLASPAVQPGANQALRYPLPPQSGQPVAPPPLLPSAPAQSAGVPIAGPQPASFSPA